MKIDTEIERIIDPETTKYHGCGDHGCLVEKPKGMGTNASCRCHRLGDKHARQAIQFMARKIREYEVLEKVRHIQAIKIPDSNGLLVVTVENPSDIENICMELPRFIDRIAPGIKFLVKNGEVTIESLDEKAMEEYGWIRKK